MSDFDNIAIEELRREIRKFNNDENVSKLESYYNSKSDIIIESYNSL